MQLGYWVLPIEVTTAKFQHWAYVFRVRKCVAASRNQVNPALLLLFWGGD